MVCLGGISAASILFMRSSIAARPEVIPGSLLGIGERKELGYQVLPKACGARYAKPGVSIAGTRVRMLSAVAPLPWIITIAAVADSSLAPAVRTGWPWCGDWLMEVIDQICVVTDASVSGFRRVSPSTRTRGKR